MNRKAIITLLILTLPMLALNGTIPIKDTSLNDNFMEIRQVNTEKNMFFQKTYEISSYMAPYDVKILFDDNHTGYWSSSKFTVFLQDIENQFGANVTINDKMFNETNLNDYDIIIIPEFDTNLTDSEVNALKQYLKSNGSILFLGNSYPYFSYPETYNATTLDYGIGWYEDEIQDPTDYDYSNDSVIVHVWGNNTVANFLSSDKSYNVECKDGTPILITGSNTTTYTIYPVAFGDDDTNTTSGRLQNGDIVFFAAVEINNEGRFFASGSTAMFRTDLSYYYRDSKYDTKDFAMRLIHWLMAEGLEISSVEYPTWNVKAGETTLINMTIVNNEDIDATNVHVAIEVNGTIEVLNSTQEVNIGSLAAGGQKTVSWSILATGTSEAKIILKVWSDNLRGFSKAVTISTKGFSVEGKAKPAYVILGTNITLGVNVTNPFGSGINASNVNVTIDIPAELDTSDALFYHYDFINESKWVYIEIELMPLAPAAPATINIFVESENFGTASTTVNVYAFEGRIAIFYQHDVSYYRSYRFNAFIDNVSQFREVYAMDEMITEDALNITDFVIMPEPDNPLTTEEINLFTKWVNETGGVMLILGDWYNYFDPDNLNPFTSQFGIVWNDGEIMDDVFNYDGNAYKPILYNFTDNAYGKYLGRGVDRVVFHGGTFLNTTNGSGFTVYPVLLGNDPSYAVNSSGDAIGINGTNITAFAVAEFGEGLVFASGSPYAFRDYDNYTDMNYPFIENILRLAFKRESLNDYQAPTISITTPANMEKIGSLTVDVTWDASDNVGIYKFEVLVNGELIATLDGTATSYSVLFPSDGEYEVTVVAHDWARWSASDSITLIIDAEAPEITITSPANGTKIKETSIEVTWTIIDELVEEYGNFTIILDGDELDTVPSNTTSYTITNLSDGAHNITIVANGPVKSGSDSVIIIVDTTPPTLSFTPANDTEVVAGNVTVQVNASDVSGLDRIEILVDGSLVYSGDLTGTSISATYYIEIEPGDHTITVKVYDTLGNVAEETHYITAKSPPTGLPPTYIAIATIIIIILAVLGYLFIVRKK